MNPRHRKSRRGRRNPLLTNPLLTNRRRSKRRRNPAAGLPIVGGLQRTTQRFLGKIPLLGGLLAGAVGVLGSALGGAIGVLPTSYAMPYVAKYIPDWLKPYGYTVAGAILSSAVTVVGGYIPVVKGYKAQLAIGIAAAGGAVDAYRWRHNKSQDLGEYLSDAEMGELAEELAEEMGDEYGAEDGDEGAEGEGDKTPHKATKRQLRAHRVRACAAALSAKGDVEGAALLNRIADRIQARGRAARSKRRGMGNEDMGDEGAPLAAEEYSDASLADAGESFGDPDFSAEEIGAIEMGRMAFTNRFFPRRDSSPSSGSGPSDHAGKPGRRIGWLIYWIGMDNVQAMAKYPKEQRMEAIEHMRREAAVRARKMITQGLKPDVQEAATAGLLVAA